MTQTLSLAQARRVALAAQGFGARSGAEVGRAQLLQTLRRLNLFQIDSVSAVVRAHYTPLFSRRGSYRMGLLDEAAQGRKRAVFEYWAHEASFLPVETWPLMQWRMRRARAGQGVYGRLAAFGRERRDYVAAVLSRIEREGPLSASALEGERGPGGWWGWSEAKTAVEWLFWAGLVTTAARRGFERVYDLPERVLGRAATRPAPNEADAQRALLAQSARAHGIASAACLRDYFRLPPADAKARLAELVEDGTLLPVRVEGWERPLFLHKDARLPRRVEAQALLSPFDPLVWERARAEALFGFRYRIEIYTPAPKRQHGYYVLPFLRAERLRARVDLRADRPNGTFRVLAAFGEDHASADDTAALATELLAMADWLGLPRLVATPAGDLGPALLARLREAAPDRVSTAPA